MGLKAWSDRTRARNQARAERMNAWMDTHGPNAFSESAAEIRRIDYDAVASCAGVHVYPDRIVRSDWARTVVDEQLIAGVTASVEASGNISTRGTLTRAALVGGGWQKTVDAREAALVVDGPGFRWVVPIKPDQTGQAREFAATVTTIGRQATSSPG